MRWAIPLALAGCIDDVDARWQLDHDRVVAVRATPPHLAPDERAVLDALVAHAGGPTALDTARTVTTPTAPAALQGAIAFDGTAWTITAPSADALAASRPVMGLADGALVPLDLLLAFGDAPMYVTKTVWLGDHAENPTLPPITIDDAPAGDTLELAVGRDVYLEAATDLRVNWLTSVGTLHQDDVARAFVRVDAPAAGELAVVVRSPDGGVAWRVWSTRTVSTF